MLVVSSPVGVNVRDSLQQTTIPSLEKAPLSLDGNLFAIDPVVTKQKSTTVKLAQGGSNTHKSIYNSLLVSPSLAYIVFEESIPVFKILQRFLWSFESLKETYTPSVV